MKVLLSIKPEYAESILSGKKKYEFRKNIFRNKNVDTIVIYATMPVGKVIGEFKVGDILALSPSELWDKLMQELHILFLKIISTKEKRLLLFPSKALKDINSLST